MNRFSQALDREALTLRVGRIVRTSGTIIEAAGPDACVGEICTIVPSHGREAIEAEVIGIENGHTLLFPYGEMHGVSIGCEVVATGRLPVAPVAGEMGGLVLNAFGESFDPAKPFQPTSSRALHPPPLNPLQREPVKQRVQTGVRAIDQFLTLGRGQKIGLFAGGGVGKTSLLQQIIQGTDADLCVIALVGERGREVLDFVHHVDRLGLRNRTVIVAATSDQPAINALTQHTYDGAGNVLTTTEYGKALDSPEWWTQSMEYMGYSVAHASDPATNRTTTNQYDSANRLNRSYGPTGTKTEYGYDALGRLTDLYTYANNGKLLNRTDTTWDRAGRKTSETQGAGTNDAATRRRTRSRTMRPRRRPVANAPRQTKSLPMRTCRPKASRPNWSTANGRSRR
ncbi:hypothetical protein [Andreprevotia chitinilytica]|uniref:hypothetical protein n=1 Tax=Andreprevotia chitinilytica TaxID=396808 RepID=UPI00068B4BE6|nr:hypothetical protein [Andreprevotia chitinilytica]